MPCYFILLIPEISIHALREEGDDRLDFSGVIQTEISIHALREEGDHAGAQAPQDDPDFYPRPPRGGRRISICSFG